MRISSISRKVGKKNIPLTYTPNENSKSACAYAWRNFESSATLPKMRTVDILSRLCECAGWSEFITKNSLFKYTKNFTTKIWKLLDKNSDMFHISAQNIDCGYWLEPPWQGGSTEYPQSMFLSRNKKINMYPCKPQFYYIKVGFKEVNII